MKSTTCPECGAILKDDLTCQALFDRLLALEFSDPEYGQVHLLTVACYMIQHGRYSDEGLKSIERTLREYLENGAPVEWIRRRSGREVNQDRRIWKVGRGPGDPPQKKIAWSMTIADAAAQDGNAAGYSAAVRQWARAVLAEMKPLLPG